MFLGEQPKTTFFTLISSYGDTMTPLAKKVFELFGKPEHSTKPEEKSRAEQPQPVVLWLCPHCGEKTVRLDPVDVTILPTQLWTCSGCGAYGATREGAAFPVVWVSKRTQQ